MANCFGNGLHRLLGALKEEAKLVNRRKKDEGAPQAMNSRHHVVCCCTMVQFCSVDSFPATTCGSSVRLLKLLRVVVIARCRICTHTTGVACGWWSSNFCCFLVDVCDLDRKKKTAGLAARVKFLLLMSVNRSLEFSMDGNLKKYLPVCSL